MFRPLSVLLACVLCATAARATEAIAWPQWQGPEGDGHAGSPGIPLKWSESENVKWKTPTPGEGWSTPVVGHGKVWMTTSTPEGRSARLLCVDLASGKLLKDMELINVEAPQKKHKMNSYASPSPILDGDRLYCCFGAHGTVCVDTNTLKILWRNMDLKVDHQNGPGSTPILYKGKLILCCDGMDQQYLAALNISDGSIAWKTPRSQKFKATAADMKKAYGTPMILDIDGKDVVVEPAAEYLYANDPDSGRELWWVKYPGFSNVPKPIVCDGVLVVCTGFMRSEIWGIKIPAKDQSGDLTASNVLWRYKIQVPNKPTPVAVGPNVYMVSDSGTVTCLKAKTGDVVWKEQIGGEFSASPLVADNHIYFFDIAGNTTVIEPGETYKLLTKNTLEDGFMASAAVAGKALILRTKTKIYRIEQ
jgi:outer membrane protein assembly factor BamB